MGTPARPREYRAMRVIRYILVVLLHVDEVGPLGEKIVLKYWAKVATRDDVIYGEVYELIHNGLSCVADDDHPLDLY